MQASNALTLTTDQTAKLAKAVEAAIGDSFSGFDYLKFAKGKWTLREGAVNPDDKFIAHCESWSYGGVKFVDGKPVDRRIGRAIDGFQMPEQDDLPDRDAKSWPKINGVGKDPWSLQSYLVLENVRSGEMVLFATSAKGGRKAIGQLVRTATTNPQRGNPIVKLAASSYRHASFGDVSVPVFEVVSWFGANRKPEPTQEVFADEITF
jgi:hypothetical protein